MQTELRILPPLSMLVDPISELGTPFRAIALTGIDSTRRGVFIGDGMHAKQGTRRAEREEKKAWRRNMKKRNERVESCANKLKRTATKAETLLMKALGFTDLRYDFQHPVTCGSKYKIVDFYFPRGKYPALIVEVDGGYHETPEQQKRDREREEWITRNTGASFMRVSNADVYTMRRTIIAMIIARVNNPK